MNQVVPRNCPASGQVSRSRGRLPDFPRESVELQVRFWSGARQLETREAQHAVIRQVLADFRQAGVATGSDVQVIEAGPTLGHELKRRL